MREEKELALDCGVIITVTSDGHIYKDGIEVNKQTYKEGYEYVTFKGKEHYLVHKLVASAFIHPLERGDRSLHVHHINEIKNDNRVENLQVMTMSEHQHLHKQKHPLEKVCKVCGKTYIPNKTKRARSQTCSWECSRILAKQNMKRRKVNQYSMDGTFIKTWNAARDAQNELHIQESGINMCCHGKLNSSGGYKWKYAE